MSAARKLRRQIEKDKPRPPRPKPKCPDCGESMTFFNTMLCRCKSCGAEFRNVGLLPDLLPRWEKTKEGNVNA